MIGAIAGAILLAPLFFGLGRLSRAGRGLDGLLSYGTRPRPPPGEALDAAFGAMMGRFLGTVCKCGAGGAMLALAANHIWPQPLPCCWNRLKAPPRCWRPFTFCAEAHDAAARSGRSPGQDPLSREHRHGGAGLRQHGLFLPAPGDPNAGTKRRPSPWPHPRASPCWTA